MAGTTKPSDNQAYYWLIPIIFLCALVAYYRLAYPLLNDNDVPWHIAIGQMLLATHHLPKNDTWAYGNQDHPWYILSWVWDLTLGIVQRLFGELGTFIFTLSVAAGLTAATTWQLLKRNIALPAVLMTSMMTGLCLLDYVTARPQMAGYVLAFIFHTILHKSRGDSGYKHLRWLPLLMLIWTNTHGSFTVGFIIMGTYAFEAWLTHKHDWMKRIVFVSVASVFTGLINPYGFDIIPAMLVSFTSPATRYTAEWLPFSFGISTGLSLWLIMVLLVSNLRGASLSIADKILAMGWLLATMFSIRNGAFFILMSAPYLATCFDEQTRNLRKTQPESPLALFMKRQKLVHVWLASTGVFIVLCTFANATPHADKIETEDYSARDAIAFALEHYPDHHFYTDYSLGGQVIYRTQGKLSYFMDSRASTAYDYHAVDDFMGFLKLTDGWEETLHKQGLNGILMAQNTQFVIYYDKGWYHNHWKLVFAGKRANVYIARP